MTNELVRNENENVIEAELVDSRPLVHLVEIGEYEDTRVIAAFMNEGEAQRFVDSYNEWRPKDQEARLGDSVPFYGPAQLQ